MASVIIVGGGIAGLTAAYYAAARGASVKLYEASPHLGGRCRAYFDEKLGFEIDNGNHILTGACRATMELIDALGVHDRYHSPTAHYDMKDKATGKSWKIAPPFSIPFLSFRERLRILKMLTHPGDKTVADRLDTHTDFYTRVLEPFCISALNTQPKYASAKLAATVIRQLAGKEKAQPWLPVEDWGHALIEPLYDQCVKEGVVISKEMPLREIETKGDTIAALCFTEQRIKIEPESKVVFALTLPALQKLLPELTIADSHESILNGHFALPNHPYPNGKMIGLTGTIADWVFCKKGYISTTSSAASRIEKKDNAELAAQLWQDCCFALGMDSNAPIPPYRILHEKRATFAATPENDKKRLPIKGHLENLYFAGDHVQTDLPATIEGAIRSGKKAAELATA